MLYLAEYYVRWVATSHDESKDRLRRVIIEHKSWDLAREKIKITEEAENTYCKVEFRSLTLLEGVVLWK